MTATESFLEAYSNYASNLTDAPKVYHAFASLNLLSLAVARTPIKLTPKPLYPNIWTIFIGASGITHKSTAIELATRVLPDDYDFLPNDFTPESLHEGLSNRAQGLIVKDEIGGFLVDHTNYKKVHRLRAANNPTNLQAAFSYF